jgi:phosphohistidine phosphatase
MPRKLLILRHAKSDWDSPAATDFDRPLAKRGRKDAPRMGRWLKARGLVPSCIVCSPAERAKQTLLAVMEPLQLPPDMVLWDERIYMASLSTLLQVLADCPADTQTVLLAGHNPGMEELVSFLGGDAVTMPPNGKLMPTAALAELEMPGGKWDKLARGSGKLIALARPREIA